MKRIGYIYEKIVDVENCKQAILKASKGKKNRKVVQKILNNIDYYAQDLSNRLQELRFTSPYYMQKRKDRSSGKIRDIAIPKFYPDLCSQHAINQVLIPIIEKSSLYYDCANFKGRGMKRANKGTKRLRKMKCCLKTDISKCYQSIENERLKAFLRTKIKDKKALMILDTLIDSIKGLPIGNYTSPQLCDWYLQNIDRILVQKVKVKKLVRYADDTTIGDNNKRRLHYALKVMKEEYKKKGLKIKPNYQIFKIHVKEKNTKYGKGRKIDFIGNCYSSDYITIRKHTALNIMRRARLIMRLISRGLEICHHLANGFISQCSAFLHANAFKMQKKYMKHIKELKEVIRRYSKCGITPKVQSSLVLAN